jgi:hypothetical protein
MLGVVEPRIHGTLESGRDSSESQSPGSSPWSYKIRIPGVCDKVYTFHCYVKMEPRSTSPVCSVRGRALLGAQILIKPAGKTMSCAIVLWTLSNV